MSRRERFEKSAAETAVNAILGLGRSVRYGIHDPNNYFQEAKEHLGSGTLENPSSLILVGNINGRTEAIVAADVVARNLATLDRVSTLTDVKFLDSKRNRVTSALIKRASEAKGFRVFPVIPPNEMGYYSDREHADAISGKSPLRFTAEAMIEAVGVLKRPGEVLIISPEEPDSEDAKNPANQVRQLSRAYEGLDTILRHSSANALVLPVFVRRAIRAPREKRRFVPSVPPPPYRKIIVTPGQLFSYEEVREEYEKIFKLSGGKPNITMNDLIMMRVAQLAPAQSQGPYRPFIARA